MILFFSSRTSRSKILLCFDFKALEDSPGDGISFEDLIRRQVSLDLPKDLLDFVKRNPKATLIVVDNVCEPKSGCQESDFADSFEEKMPFSALLKKLVTGKILKGATVLTLSRLTENSVADLFGVASQTELMGFSPSEINGYIKKYFSNTTVTEWSKLHQITVLSSFYSAVNETTVLELDKISEQALLQKRLLFSAP